MLSVLFFLKGAFYDASSRSFSGHALDQMQNRGIPPSVVEETIQRNIGTPNKVSPRIQFYDSGNNVFVIIENDKVVTVTHGEI